MRVTVNDKTVFCFPTNLIVNRFFAGMIRRRLRKEGVKLTRKQTVKMIKALRKYKKRNPNWNLVEVTESDGEHVIVRI